MQVTQTYTAKRQHPVSGLTEQAFVYEFDFGNTMEVFRDGSEVFRSENGRKLNERRAYIRCCGMRILAKTAHRGAN